MFSAKVSLRIRPREFIRSFDPQCFDIFEERFFKLRGGFCERNSSLAGCANRFVINVSDVHDAMHFVTAQLKVPLEQILEDIRAEISDMSAAVDRWPAGVDVDLASGCVARLEILDLPRVGIKEPQRHVYLVVSSRVETSLIAF